MSNPLIPSDGVYRLSAHKLNMMLECPFKAYLYLSHFPEGPSEDCWAKCGSAVHDYAEDMTKGTLKEPEYYLQKYEVPQVVPGMGINLHDMFYKCIENVPKFAKLEGAIPEMTEYTDFVTPKGRKVSLQTRIDLQVENSTLPEAKGKVVVDYKTGKDVNKEEYRLQARCYMFAKGGEYKALFYSLLSGKYFVIDKLPEDYIPKMCDNYIDHIENRELERTPNQNCDKFCPYREKYCAPNVYFQQLVPPGTENEEVEEDDSDNA